MAWLAVRVAHLAILVLATLFGVTDGQTGGFSGSCFAETHDFVNPYLGMYCRNRNVWEYGYNWTWYARLLYLESYLSHVDKANFDRINLELCIGNRNGRLTGWENGNYNPTCGGCSTSLKDDSIVLGCHCLDNQGRRPGSSVNLNDFIFNQDGRMGCYSNLGNKTLVGPAPAPHQTSN